MREQSNHEAGFAIVSGPLEELKRQFPHLHPTERAQFRTFKYELRQSSYLLGKLSARHAVQRIWPVRHLSDIQIDSGVFLYPIVRHPDIRNLQVSITHCKDVGLALAFPESHPLGTDVEMIKEDKIEAIASQMTAQDKDLIRRAQLPSAAMGHTLVWTVKEALSKVLKTGLMMDFKLFELKSIEKKGQTIESHYQHSLQYKALSRQLGNYVVSVVLPAKTSVDLTEFWAAFPDR
ncbi:MAG: 4'-phosphopantetheinyl transferase superfamily protein [Bacteroidota bacterium]